MVGPAHADRPFRARLPVPGFFQALTPCREACPVKTDAAAYVRAVAAGEFDAAYRIARVPNPLASICGRICSAPCEQACRRGKIDAPVSIRALKRAALEGSRYGRPGGMAEIAELLRSRADDARRGLLDFQRRSSAFSGRQKLEHSVGVVGSGPAGLACAHDLALLGYAVRIYEMEPVPAGMLTLGIPAYRLPRDLVDGEVAFIRQLGVDIETGCEVGVDVQMEELLARHDALVVAVGAKRSRALPLEGVDGPGVLGGVEFLREVNLGRTVQLGPRVVVIGGGNVAFDVARTAIRNLRIDVTRMAAQQGGVAEVRLVCLEAREEMPADDIEVIEGAEEGIRLLNRLGPEAVVRDDEGRVVALRCKGVERVFDTEGGFAPLFNDERTEVAADTILFAVGQRFDTAFLGDVADLELEPNGAPRVSDGTRTSHSAIWVAGDLAHGPRLAIDAIASGKQAAASIHRTLTGEELEPQRLEVHVPRPGFVREQDYELQQRAALPVLPADERVRRPEEIVERGPTRLWALHEAGRCLNCSVHTLLEPSLCVLCGGCVDVCPMSCLKLVPVGTLAPDSDNARDSPGVSSALVKDESVCIRCGLCAQRCPTDAITMDECFILEAPHV